MHDRSDRPDLRWPGPVLPTVRARADRFAREATGRVVDLGVDHGYVFPAASAVLAPHEVGAGGSIDHVVSVGALTANPDLPALLHRMLGWLAHDGRVVFLEPIADPAPRPRRWRATRPSVVTPRDVTWELWEHGFAVTTADHVQLDPGAAPLDRWVFGLARRRHMPRPTEALVADGSRGGRA